MLKRKRSSIPDTQQNNLTLMVETLEERVLLAGDVFAAVSGGNLVVNGDSKLKIFETVI